MLSELWIRNLVLIEEAQLHFGPGLSAVTGETGAGKSLVVASLDLALGAKASSDLVRRGTAEAEVIARFETDSHPAAEDGAVILRRVISSEGKSRAYLNDRPVTVRALREAGQLLADLHGQHEQQGILDERVHLDLLDSFAGCVPERDVVCAKVDELETAYSEREAFLESLRRASEEQEYLAAQLKEIQEAELDPSELAALELERKRLRNAGKLAASVHEALESLDGEAGAESLLSHAREALSQGAALDETLAPQCAALDEALVVAQETARDIRHYVDSLESDDMRLEQVEARLSRLNQLCRKHHTDLKGVITKGQELAAKVRDIDNAEQRQEELDAAVSKAASAARRAAGDLSSLRRQAATRLTKKVNQELRGLGMAEAALTIQWETPRGGVIADGVTVDSKGAERVVFHFAANSGEPGGPVAKVASGGELSRVMLALKNVLRDNTPVVCTIFDEIDTGVGGVVAEAMGSRLAELSRHVQVLVVTHQAVIAGQADHQFRLNKVSGERTTVHVQLLDRTQREEELARMMAGNQGKEGAKRAAQALLDGVMEGGS